MKKIFITGGHFAPAKAIMSRLSNWEIYYIGRKFSMEDDKALALEYQEIKNAKYLVITAGRLQRKFFINIFQSVKSLLKIPVGLAQAFWWLLFYRPNIILSFGGYVAVPVVVCAWVLDIPVITHEQTKSMGLANKIIGLFSNKILTWPIIRQEILTAKIANSKMLYITGGNQGSHVINLAVAKIIEDLAKKYQVIHQTGDSSYHDFENAKKLKNYEVKKFLTAGESAEVLAKAFIVISRAGANTLNELQFLGKPAILVPIPWSSGNEQQKNAQYLANLGMAEIISQDKLSGKTLLETVEKISANYDYYSNNAQKAGLLIDPHGAEKVVEEINQIKV